MNSPWIRRIAIALGALVLLLVVVAGVLIATFDANRFKGLAIDWMKTERQRTLVIDGPIELSVFPRLAIKVSKVRLSERGRNDEFAAIDEASLAVETLPLLRKQVVVDRVLARGVRATYLRDAKGVRNIDDLMAPSAASAPAGKAEPAPSAGGATVRFDVSAVKLDDLRLRLRDAMANLDGEVAVQAFSSGRIANQAETPLSLRATVNLSKPQALKLVLDGSTTATIDLDKNAVSMTKLKLDAQVDGDAVKGLAVQVTGALAFDNGALRAGPLQLAIKSATFGATTLGASTLEVKKLLYSTEAQKLELDALKVALAGRQGANPFELTLDWPQLAVSADALKGSALSGSFKLAGTTALAGAFRSGAPNGNFDALRLPGLALTLQGSMGPRKVDGNLKANLKLELAKKAATLDAIDLRATLSDPGLQPLQLTVRGAAEGDAKAAAWHLDGALNANTFASSGQAMLGGAVPNIKAQARFDSLDLNKLLAPDKPSAAVATAASGPAPADTPVALDGLNAINGHFNVSANAFAFRQYKVSDVKIDAALDNGMLRIARLAGRSWGGAIEATGSAEARSKRVAVKLNAEGVNVNALLKDVAGKDLLEGTGRVVADVNTSGATVGAMRSALAGSASLQLRDGAVKGFNLARGIRQAKAALSGQQDAVAKARTTEKTDFSEMSASARIANGVATSDDLDVKSPYLRIGGAGRFDIGRSQIDYTAKATVTGTSVGQDGADLAALKGVTVPVQLTGPFDAMDWKIQWSGVAAAAVQNKLKDKLAERLGIKPAAPQAGANAASAPPAQSTKDKLRDKLLKGLTK
jgi:AsmA protein